MATDPSSIPYWLQRGREQGWPEGGINSFQYQQGGPGQTMGGWQDATGASGIGTGLQNMYWGSDINALRHAGKDLRATAMMWVPQLLESTPEAQTLFDEEQYMDMIRPQVESAIDQMMGGYRTSMDNIRRGLAARGLSSSGLSQRLAGQQEGTLQAQSAGMRGQMLSQARMNRLQQALQYRKDIVGLGLGVPQPGHQMPQEPETSGWGQVAGTVGGAFFGEVGAGAGRALGNMFPE